ncbi:MAG: DUF5683 domain-containing protein [Candidatus Zixiibacteriota bacterium]
MIRLGTIVAFLCASPALFAQTDSTNQPDTTAQHPDTVLYNPGTRLSNIAAVNVPVDFETRRLQNPTTALFKSMAIPGWGQLGNKRITKAVIFAGLQGWFVGSALHYGGQASDYRAKYESATDILARNEWYDLYSDRRDERNKFTWFAVLLTFVGMFDAYVDAHLSAYPSAKKQQEAGFGISAPPDGTTGLTVSWTF